MKKKILAVLIVLAFIAFIVAAVFLLNETFGETPQELFEMIKNASAS